MDESLSVEVKGSEVANFTVISFVILFNINFVIDFVIDYCRKNPSAIDSYSIEPLSVLHSKLEFEW